MANTARLSSNYIPPQQARDERRSSIIALITTSGIFATVFLILFMVGLYPPNPPWEEPAGGMSIVLGSDLVGMNETFEPVAAGNNQAQQVVSSPPQEVQPEPEQIADASDQEAPALEKPRPEPKKEVKPVETKPVQTQQQPQTKPVENPQPQVNKNALFTKSDGNGNGAGGSNYSKGTGNTPGDQGDPNGDKNSTSWIDRGKGNGPSIGGGLTGRGVLSLPRPAAVSQVEGVVVVNVCVNPDGSVVSATGGARGSTISDPATVAEAENKAKNSKFKPDPDAPAMQCGTIIYNYKLQ